MCLLPLGSTLRRKQEVGDVGGCLFGEAVLELVEDRFRGIDPLLVQSSFRDAADLVRDLDHILEKLQVTGPPGLDSQVLQGAIGPFG